MASKSKGGKPEVHEVSFRPANGGVVSETRMKYKRGPTGGGPEYDQETETGVHPTMDHAVGHLKSVMSGCFGGKAEKAEGE